MKTLAMNKRIRKLNRLFKRAAYDSFWLIGIAYAVFGMMIYTVFTQNYVFVYSEETAAIISVDSERAVAELKFSSNKINRDFLTEDTDVVWHFEDDDTRYMAQWMKGDGCEKCQIEILLSDPLSDQIIMENKSKNLLVLVPVEKAPLWYRVTQYFSFE